MMRRLSWRRLIWRICVATLAGLPAAAAPAAAGEPPIPAAGQEKASASPASGQAAPTPATSATTPPGSATAAAPTAPAPTTPPREPVREGIGANMQRYHMVFLRRSGKPALPEAEGRKLMEAHLDNIRRLARERKLLLAGPFLDQSGPGSLAGIFVLATESAEEARQLVDTDPAVMAGRYIVEIVPWLGPKTLARVLEP